MYKIVQNPNLPDLIYRKSDKTWIPKDDANTSYKKFLRDVKEQSLSIVEGPDVVTPDYKAQRVAEYPSIEDQLDKIYHSTLTAWKADIKAVKDKYPKTNTGSTTVGSVPSWVQEEVDKLPNEVEQLP